MGLLLVLAGTDTPAAVRDETAIAPPGTLNISLTEAEQKWLREHPVVLWGADPHWPPFSERNAEGALIGIDADITRLAAKRAGLRIQLVPANSWAESLAKAKAGEVDFLSATARSPERLERFDFTAAYGAFPVVIIMRDEGPFMTAQENLGSMTISAPRDYVVTEQLRQDYPQARVLHTDTVEEALRLVVGRKADATVQNLAAATRAIRLNGFTNLKIVGVTRYEFPLRFAVREDLPELTSLLNKGLATITKKEQATIFATHLTPDIARARDWGIWRRRALYATMTAVVAICLGGLWNLTLKRQIRQRKAAEQALVKARDVLQQRSAELQAANENLEFFSSSVAHDLRAPLRRVNSYLELLGLEDGQSLPGSAKVYITKVLREVSGMDALIHDLLEFSHIERAKLNLQRVDMGQLVSQVVEEFLPHLQGRRVVWKLNSLCPVQGDPDLVRRAVVNLLDNALKYTQRRPEAVITVDALPAAPGDKEAVFYVRDNGCGFDVSEAGEIFTPFHRLHSSKEYEGTGIGLATVQKIIQRHGGRVWFESEPDKGATFFFALPRG